MHTTLPCKLFMVLTFGVFIGMTVLGEAALGPPAKEQRLQFKTPPKSIVYDTAFSPDAKLLAVTYMHKEIIIFDVATGKKRLVLQTTQRGRSVAFSPDGKTLVSASGESPYSRPKDPGEIKIWDLQTGDELISLVGQGQCWKVAFTPDGKSVVSASGDSTIRIWDAASGMVKAILTDHTEPVRALAFSPDGKVFASGSFDGNVIFWDATTFKKQKTFRPHTKGVQCIAFAPSGRRFATSEWHNKANHISEVKIWDFASGRLLTQVQGVASLVLCLDFPRDERMLALAGGDKQNSADVKLIEVASGKTRAVLQGHREWLECISFSPDGLFFVGGGGYNQKNAGELSAWYLADLKPPKAAGKLSASDVERLWKTLASEDAVEAYQAIHLLVAAPTQALAMLKDQVRPSAPVDEKKILNLIKELDDNDFQVREKAMHALAALGEQGEPMMLKALKDNPGLEVKERLETALAAVGNLSPSLLQQYRAIEVLEQIGSPAAKEIMEKLAKGQANARLTQEAQATLKRLAK